MAWFGEELPSLSDLTGQLTNFTKEVLSDGTVDEIDERSKELNEANKKCVELQEVLNSKDAEISLLRRQNCELQKAVVELNSETKDSNDNNQDGEDEVFFFWDPPSTKNRNSKSQNHVRQLEEQLAQATMKIKDLESEVKRIQKVNNSSLKDELTEEPQAAGLKRAEQDMMNCIIPTEEKTLEAESNSKRIQSDEVALINDFRTVLSKLNSLQKLDIVRGALKALETETETCSKANKQEKFDFDETFKRPSSVDHESASSNMESELYKKIEELQEENKTLFASVEELDQQHEESIEKLLSLKEEIEKKHECLQHAYEQLYVDYNQAQDKVTELEGKLAEPGKLAQTEAVSRSIQVNVLDNVDKHVQTNEPETEEEERSEEQATRSDVNELTKKEIEDLESNLPSIPEANEERVASLESEIDSLHEEVKRLQSENSTLRKKNSLRKKNTMLRGNGPNETRLKNQAHSATASRTKISERLENIPEDIEDTFNTMENLKRRLHTALDENDELRKKVELLESTEKESQEQLRMSLEKCEGLEGNIEFIEELKFDLEEAKTELIVLENDKKYLMTQISDKKGTIELFNDELYDLSRSVNDEINLNKSLKDTIYQLQQKNKSLAKENTSWRKKLTRSQSDLTKKMTVKENELKDVKKQLEEFQLAKEANVQLQLQNTHQKDVVKSYTKIHNKLVSVQNSNAQLTNKVKALRSREKTLQKLQESTAVISEMWQNKYRDLKRDIQYLQTEKQELLNRINENVCDNEEEEIIALLEEKRREVDTLKDDIIKLMEEITNSQKKLQEIIENYTESSTMAKETIESLSYLIKEKDEEIDSLKNELELAKNNTEMSNHIAVIQNERDELVKLVTTKHNESVQYHGEIQRLTHLFYEQAAQIESLLAEKDVNLSELKEKDAQLLWSKNELQAVQQRLRNAEESNPKETCGIVEHSTQIAEIGVLNEKCNALEVALIQEQSNNRMLQNQLNESQSKEASAGKELERLRTHLVDMEASYTEDALVSEEARKELEMKLQQAEEKVKMNSNAYTSASIRANQQVETLQQQMALIVQQRDDIQNKLASAEDKILSQNASLTNLQIVLEQFQQDKEKDIIMATERIQSKLTESYKKQEELANDVVVLKEQLAEAKECLQAASRLSEQLDKKTERIEQLSQEVDRLTNLVNTADHRIEEAKLSGESKVDKTLIKNLLLGYLSSSAADKSSVLRVFSTVLEFSEAEKDKAGLNNAVSQNSWFSRLSSGSTIPNKDQEASLSAAFVRFLENESKPKPQLPALPIQTSPLSRPGHSRQQSTSSTQSTSLLSNVNLPTFPDFIPARNTGSILKEVLKDT